MGSTERLPNGRFPKGNGAGTGGPKKGTGWGGPAKGNGNGGKRKILNTAGPGRGNYSKEGEGRLERQARHAEEMREVLYSVAIEGETESVRVQAADKLLNRIEGLPVQKVVTAESDPVSLLSDLDLDLEIERTRQRQEKLAELRAADQAEPPDGTEKGAETLGEPS